MSLKKIRIVDFLEVLDVWVLTISTVILIVMYSFVGIDEKYFSSIISFFLAFLSVNALKSRWDTRTIISKITNYHTRTGINKVKWTWFDDGRLTVGGTRNVSLRAMTIKILLKHFQKVDTYHDMVKDASREIGISFGRDLESTLINKNALPTTLQGKVELCMSYDTDAGLGKFDYSDINITEGKIGGYLKIKNSFLTAENNVGEDGCLFFEGYIEGIFSQFIGVNVNVEETACASRNLTSQECMFKITMKNKINGGE